MQIKNNIEKVKLVHSGADYFSRLEYIIQEAKYEIHLQYYIFKNDTIGNKILQELKKAAVRRVRIYILLDGFGSFSFSKDVIEELTKTGIHFRFFSPLLSSSSLYIGRRLHHKVVVADDQVVLIGGINIADKYVGSKENAAWLDYSVQINDIKIAKKMQLLCRDLFFKKKYFFKRKIESVFNSGEETAVSILQNDWLKSKNEIYNAYIDTFKHAEKEITIVGSYFLPGRRLNNAIKNAAKNKVKIRLILSGKSDVPLSRRATNYIYSSLLTHNIELYEWNKTILHGKAAIVDHYWTTIGSFNLNNLSTYGSLEMNVEIKSIPFSNTYQAHLNDIISQSQRITPKSLERKSIISNLKNYLSYCASRLILLFIKQKEN